MRPRNKVWPESPDPERERAVEHIFDHICRHLVCLGIRYALLDDKGHRTDDKEYFIAYSGFVMCIDNVWFILTAGHILKEELDDNLARKKIELSSCRIVDYFGKDAKVHYPTPFPYEDAPKAYIDDKELGLDIGLIFLRDFFREGMISNGIIPITEENWVHQHKVEFEAHGVLGFPKELVDRHTKPVSTGEPMNSVVAPVLIPLERITDPTAIPSSVEIPASRYPWFLGRLTPAEVPNIKGMSGGPILGFRGTPDGGLESWVVAVQSCWYEESRIIRGCPVPVFAELIRTAIRNHSLGEDQDSGSSDGSS
jgi:hypothetical protein